MRNSRAVIHLDNLKSNLAAIRNLVGPGPQICLAIKADGYGHGAVPVARTAVSSGVTFLAVSSVDEGLELRSAGIKANILLLGIPVWEDAMKAVKAGMSAIVTDLDSINMYRDAGRQADSRAMIHLKIDTGMGRLGCLPEDVPCLASSIAGSAFLELQGICTHFPVADTESREFTLEQLRRFDECVGSIRGLGLSPGILHAANSAGLEAYPEAWLDMVRPGIIAYGYRQAEIAGSGLKVRPVMELRSKVVFLKRVPAGMSLSYGHTYTTPKPTVIATVAAGYADGYPRLLSNKGEVLIRGRRYPVVGTVCMDQILIDVGIDSPVKKYDEVVLFGPDSEGPDAAEVAAQAGTIAYEITCGVNNRIPRDYIGG